MDQFCSVILAGKSQERPGDKEVCDPREASRGGGRHGGGNGARGEMGSGGQEPALWALSCLDTWDSVRRTINNLRLKVPPD